MKIRYIIIVLAGFFSSLLYGCAALELESQSQQENNKSYYEFNEYEQENYVSIQEYRGEGFTLRNANPKIDDIIEKNREDIVKAAELFFKDEYNSHVMVHNIVSAVDAATVFVESIDDPHFYTNAIVPINVRDKVVNTSNVWSLEGQVEDAIRGGLYAMAYEEQFKNLDLILENIAEKYPVVGTPLEVIERVKGDGYMTPYYFIATSGDVFAHLFAEYMENPHMTKSQLKDFFKQNQLDPNRLIFGIEFYMEDPSQKPSEEIYDAIFKTLEEAENIPRGEYLVYLNDNFIDRIRAIGKKESTLETSIYESIIKN